MTNKLNRNILRKFENIPYFTIEGFNQIAGTDESDNQTVRQFLARWVATGELIRLKNGTYMSNLFFERHKKDASFMPVVSAILNPLSYVSTEYILHKVSMLTEATYPVTSITIKNTKKLTNQLGSFIYQNIKNDLYEGFVSNIFHGIVFHYASKAKALFDYLYLRPLPRKLRKPTYRLAEELRLNMDNFSGDDFNEFRQYVALSDTPKMHFIEDNLRES